jgi:hydrogenase expression/formation protein HypC
MCLAVPGKIIGIHEENAGGSAAPSSLLRMGRVDFGGVVKEVSLAYVPGAEVGNYVIVHVGFAISILDEREAEQVLEDLRQMEETEERTQ